MTTATTTAPAPATPAPAYSAAQWAIRLDVTPQRLRQMLAAVAPTRTDRVHGNDVALWTWDHLTGELRQRLEATATRQRYRNAQAMLASPLRPWAPAFDKADIQPEDWRQASLLQQALLPVLERKDDASLSAAELRAHGVLHYCRVFGRRTFSERRWFDLFKRTLRRDAGAGDWHRLDLYLPDHLRPLRPVAKLPAGCAEEFADITAHLASCAQPGNPNATEKRGIWTLAFEHFRRLAGQGLRPAQAERRVRDFLWTAAPWIAPSREALRKKFQRDWRAFQVEGGDLKALRDGRETNGARWAFPEEDRDRLIQRAVFTHRGPVAPAWRELLRAGFSEATRQRYAGAAASKSHVPARILEDVGPEVEILTVLHQGPRAFDAIKGHVTRSYEGIYARQCMMADDFTMPVYFHVPDSQGWFNLVRGQTLVFIDFRTLRVVGWSLKPDPNYSSLDIRSLCTHVFSEFGIPQVLYFERGIWKSASLLTGKNQGAYSWAEVGQGLREFGIRFIHAIRPRTKAVERIGGLLQDRMEAEPSYCGRDERRDCPEHLRKNMAKILARKAHPEELGFPSYDEWNQRLGQIMEHYNQEPQQGRILDGRSPEQAFGELQNPNDPPISISPELRCLLACDKRTETVTLNGVTTKVGKQTFNYRGEQIAHLVGREVLLHFNPEEPDIAVVTDRQRRNPIAVERSENPNALECLIAPESGTLGRESSRIEGQASYLKARFNVLKPKSPLPCRPVITDAATQRFVQQANAQTEQLRAGQRAKETRKRREQVFQQRTGIVTPAAEDRPAVPSDDLRALEDFLKADPTEL